MWINRALDFQDYQTVQFIKLSCLNVNIWFHKPNKLYMDNAIGLTDQFQINLLDEKVSCKLMVRFGQLISFRVSLPQFFIQLAPELFQRTNSAIMKYN